jgi:hypothetical protein
MQYYVGLDVSVKETSVCIIDKTGKVIREARVATTPVAILAVLTEEALAIERIGFEAGPLSQWLYSALAEAGLPVICVETRHMNADQPDHEDQVCASASPPRCSRRGSGRERRTGTIATLLCSQLALRRPRPRLVVACGDWAAV